MHNICGEVRIVPLSQLEASFSSKIMARSEISRTRRFYKNLLPGNIFPRVYALIFLFKGGNLLLQKGSNVRLNLEFIVKVLHMGIRWDSVELNSMIIYVAPGLQFRWNISDEINTLISLGEMNWPTFLHKDNFTPPLQAFLICAIRIEN